MEIVYAVYGGAYLIIGIAALYAFGLKRQPDERIALQRARAKRNHR